jgi:hypothetical protein
MSTIDRRTRDWRTFISRGDKNERLKPQVHLALLLALFLMIGMISGCNFKGHGGGGGGGGQPAPTITSLTPSKAVVNTGPVNVTITGTNLGSTDTVYFGTYSLTPSSATSTSLVVSIPNSDMQATCACTVQVQNASDKASNNLTFTISPVPPPTLSLLPSSLPDATVNVAYSKAIFATGGVPPYTFAITGLPADNLVATTSATSVIVSGTPTAVQSSLPIGIMVTDANKSTESVSLSINVDATAATACALIGQYAFLITGEDSNGAVAMAGSVTIASDGSMSGIADFKDPANLSAGQTISGAAGSCTNGTYTNTGTLTFTAAGTARAFSFAMGTDDDFGWLSESDATGTQSTGRIELQDPAGFQQFFGSYGFGMVGNDAGGNHYAVAGAFCSNPSFGVTFVQADLDDNGTNAAGTTGTGEPQFSPPDNQGRVSTTNPFVFSAGATLNLTLYVVNSELAFTLESSSTSAQSPSAVLGGLVSGRQGSICIPQAQGGNFTNASLIDTTSTFWLQGGQGSSIGDAAGVLGFGGGNQATLSGTLFTPGGSAQQLVNAPGTFDVSSTGRGTFSFLDNNNTQHQLVFYLDGSMSAYLIQLSPDFEIGAAQLQTGVVTKSGVDITTQTVEGPYAAGSQFLPPGTPSSLSLTEVSFNNAASPPMISVAGGESGAYNFIPVGDTYQGQGLGFIFYVTNPSQLILVGPAGHGLAFLVQR